MHHAFKRTATGVALVLLLAACGGSSSDDDDGGAVTGTTQSQFGSTFEGAFNKSATAEPVAGLTPNSIGGVSFTADPVAID